MSPEWASTRGAASPDELQLIGFSHASFQKIMHPAWHPPCACPSQRVSRWTAALTRRPRTGKTVSQVLCARLYTRKRRPQNANISGMKGIFSKRPFSSSVARICSRLRTSTHSPAFRFRILCGFELFSSMGWLLSLSRLPIVQISPARRQLLLLPRMLVAPKRVEFGIGSQKVRLAVVLCTFASPCPS